MPKGEPRGPREKDLSGAPEALYDLDASIYNMKSVVDTTNWDSISQKFRGETFATIEDFRAQMLQALEAEYWEDKEFPARMMARLDGKIAKMKIHQEQAQN
ncbi:MAG: hypothetical protein WC711_01255 [Candidatus Staskawiczbacteria bacterium]|jgi:hypothetical protein